ncbi:hypothetical protein BDP27DRAFT_1316554 [Rhodocollybia butyracea]|uniref:Uncharacterized protein n=1 Tax=Rhodocollybia butyracea TaxID=206335 RepID=A0A9P5Q4T7_9AGAR|nr:hypothetical protein BDP27DRAFT_1316554 [Rhodocollybia butyracea]
MQHKPWLFLFRDYLTVPSILSSFLAIAPLQPTLGKVYRMYDSSPTIHKLSPAYSYVQGLFERDVTCSHLLGRTLHPAYYAQLVCHDLYECYADTYFAGLSWSHPKRLKFPADRTILMAGTTSDDAGIIMNLINLSERSPLYRLPILAYNCQTYMWWPAA